jgi:hypothetical protein
VLTDDEIEERRADAEISAASTRRARAALDAIGRRQITAPRCALCGQPTRTLDRFGLCSKTTASHRNARATPRNDAPNDASFFEPAQLGTHQTVGAEAGRRAPRRTGRLAGSWRPESDKATAAVRFGGGGVAYAPAMQWGIGPRPGLRGPHNIRATYFASDALASTESEIARVYAGELGDKVGAVRGA